MKAILLFCLTSTLLFAQKKMKKEEAELIIQVDSTKGGLAHGWGYVFTSHVIKTTKGTFHEKEIILTISASEKEAEKFFYTANPKDILELSLKKIKEDADYFTGIGHHTKNEKWELIYYKKIK